MSYQIADFQSQLILLGRKHRLYGPLVTEMQAISNALATDPTTHDLTVKDPPLPVKPGRDKTWFTNQALRLINRGKGGNLAPSAMATVINNALSQVAPPVNSVAPSITGAVTVGSVLTNGSPGTWQPPGPTITRQWRRGGANIAGATGNTYTTVTADETTTITCAVTATNPAGATTAVSNAIGPITP